ncbi:Vacuolar protein sorting-associated protein atg6 [Pyricularia oryzae]
MMFCQKCRTPLKLDGSLDDLNPAAYDLLVTTSSQQQAHKDATSLSSPNPAHVHDQNRKAAYESAIKNAIGSPTFKRRSDITGLRGDKAMRDSSMSFILLEESQIAPSRHGAAGRSSGPASPNASKGSAATPAADDDSANETNRILRLFEILSARSDIDHPVCVECTDILVEGLRKRLDSASRERTTYVNFLKKLELESPTDDELKAQEEALAKAKEQEAAALKELVALEKEKASLDDEILALEEESRRMDAEEEQFWRERNAFASQLADFQNERDSINSKYDHDARLLQSLQRTNVYNDTFLISHDGTFATINGLRLGRLHNTPVDWPEINAAWGHALLLVATVADKLQYRFDGYEPQPMGSMSRIIRFEPPSPAASRVGSAPPQAPKKKVLELYSSGDMPLGLTFMHRKLDAAMVAYLELVRQLGMFMVRTTTANGKPLTLPYVIDGDKINGVSIKLGIAQDDAWTKACKFVLTCCKFLLAHASNISTMANGRGKVLGSSST